MVSLQRLQTNSHFKHGVHTVIDVCGGHGIVAMLMLIYRKCRRAIVLDLHQPPSHNALLKLWAEFFPGYAAAPRPSPLTNARVCMHLPPCSDAELVFHECDMTIELPGEIGVYGQGRVTARPTLPPGSVLTLSVGARTSAGIGRERGPGGCVRAARV